MNRLSIFRQQQGAAVSRPPFGLVRRFRNRRSLFAALVCLLAGCESTGNQPPPVTAEFAKVGARQHVDLAMLERGVLHLRRKRMRDRMADDGHQAGRAAYQWKPYWFAWLMKSL